MREIDDDEGRGRPPKFTLPQRREIKKIAQSKPAEHDLPFSTWSLSRLAEFLVAEKVVDDISHEGLRMLLREEGVTFQRLTAQRRSSPHCATSLDGTDHATRQEQAKMIRRYIIWRTNHAYDKRLRRVVDRANVA